MTDYIRLSDVTFANDEDCSAPIWTAVEDAIVDQFNIRPFGAIADVSHPSFRYVRSSKRKDRFDVLAQHQRFRSTLEVVEATGEFSLLGPIETDVLRFMKLTYPHLGVLVGGMGGGKSTTVRYLLANHLQEAAHVYCDLDPNPQVAIESPDWAARLLAQQLSPAVEALIAPSEEFTSAWTWGLSNSDDRPHHAKGVLSTAKTKLRRELDDDWLLPSPAAIKIRKECHEIIHKDYQEFLTYLAFLIDYHLTVKCGGDRSKFLLVLDNIDPLPPLLQYELLRCASRLQESAQCKVLLAMRPMTYSKNLQAAHRTIDFIEHLGPDALDLIQSRIDNLVFKADLSAIRVKMKDETGTDVEIGETEIKHWIQQVLHTARQVGSPLSGEPSAREFIEGVCNNSLRSALLLAPRLFTSSVVPFVLSATNANRSPVHTRIRGHEIVRAILTGRRSCFHSSHALVVDSLFDLGRTASTISLLCKIRLLKRLDTSGTGALQMEQLRDHVSIFGISDSAILDGINAIIAQNKRLAWSDMVVEYSSLAQLPASTLKISDAGRFYVRRAILNLEYVQETHLDAPLPTSAVMRDYQNNRFSDRITSLRLFLRHLHDVDKKEVQRALSMQRGAEYAEVYGPELITSTISLAIARQVLNVGKAMLGGRINSRIASDMEESLSPWSEMENLLAHEDRDIVGKLKAFQSGST